MALNAPTQEPETVNKHTVVGAIDNTARKNTSDAIQTTPNKPAPPAFSERNINNFGTRWIENAKFIAAPARAFYEHHDAAHLINQSDPSTEMQIINLASNGGGLMVGWLIHHLLKRFNKYQNRGSMNPLYRVFKTLGNVGATVGTLIASFLPLPDTAQKFAATFLADIISIIFALLAVPYWLIRQHVLKIDPRNNNTYSVVGTEGWSKYGKTLLVLMSSIGQIIGALYAYLRQTALTTTMTIASSIVGISGFMLGIVLIPLINKITGFGLKSDVKDLFRNNYVRSGLTLGLALGSAIGFLLGTVVFPGLGSTVGMILGGAIGSTVCGVLLGVKGQQISRYTNQRWGVRENTDNSWDYASRTMSFAMGFLGTAIGFFLPIPGGALLGGAIGGALGWFTGFPIIYAARKLQPEEQRTQTLPWTQRMATGANVGSIIGAALGLAVSLALGPFGIPFSIMTGIMLFGAIGGVIGSMGGMLIGEESKKVIKKIFSNESANEPAVAANQEPATITPPTIKIEESERPPQRSRSPIGTTPEETPNTTSPSPAPADSNIPSGISTPETGSDDSTPSTPSPPAEPSGISTPETGSNGSTSSTSHSPPPAGSYSSRLYQSAANSGCLLPPTSSSDHECLHRAHP